MTPWYAMWAQRYMHEFGVTSEDLAEVAVTHRHHATLNPDSVMGSRGEITVEDVTGSRVIATPLHLFDCAIDTDGGYAIVVASAEVARGCRGKPVWVIGGAEATHTDGYTTIDAPWFPEQGHSVRRSGDIAFAQAGVTRDDIDVAGLYDCFTITVIRDLEELGFCKLGEGAAYFKEGHTRLGGSMPTNTDGGLLSNTHCGIPHGLFTVEVARQLRGECGARQVPGAKIGLSLAQGASVHGYAGTLIMAVD
jgi:acetyl-CoA acetyltransferase